MTRPARRRTSAAVVALLLGALTACGGGSQADGSQPFTGTRLDPPFEVSGTSLTAPDGSAYDLTTDTDAPLTLVFFGYTNCPDICGQVMATLGGTMARLDEEQRSQVDVVFVTTDPDRDTRSIVDDYATQFDDSFLGLTGELDDIVEVGRSMAIGVEKGEVLPSGGYDITHTTKVMAVGEDDTVGTYWDQDVSQAQLAADITTLLDEG